MPYRLKMSKIQSILALRQQGWTLTRIARELGVHRQTVARYVWGHSESTEAPTGSDGPKSTQAPTGSVDSKSTQAPRSSSGGDVSRSDCEPLRELIEKKLDQGLHAKRIHQDLVEEHGFGGSYWSVMRFVRRLGSVRELPFRRLECVAGEDYGKRGAMFSSHVPTERRLASRGNMRRGLYIISSVTSSKSAFNARLKLGGDYVQGSVVRRASCRVPAFGT